MKKILTVLLSVLLIMAAFGAGASGSYASGDLAMTSIMDSIEAGHAAHMTVTFKNDGETDHAVNALLEHAAIDAELYKENESFFVQGRLSFDDTELVSLQAVLPEDGSLLVKTSLTGDRPMMLPAGTIGQMMSIEDLLYGSLGEDTTEDFSTLPASERLRISGSNTLILAMRTLLGWVSMNQMDSDGRFYQFDMEYLEPTETRDGVAQRMIGTVYPDEFCALFWDISTLIDSEGHDFQLALADYLAEQGVTRVQARRFTDTLINYPDIQLDPELDYVEPSHTIPDDGALCHYNDVSYFFKMFNRFADKIWEESLDEPLSLVVSYDDYGEMVGFDAVLPKFTQRLPYEGSFTYSRHTDDDWQVLTTMHGELQAKEDLRIIGDYQHLNGEDVDGYNGNMLDASIGYKEAEQTSQLHILGNWAYQSSQSGDVFSENMTGNGTLSLSADGEEQEIMKLTAEGITVNEGEDYSIDATGILDIAGQLQIHGQSKVFQKEIERFELSSDSAMLLNSMSTEEKEELKNTCFSNLAATMFSLMGNKQVMDAVSALNVQ